MTSAVVCGIFLFIITANNVQALSVTPPRIELETDPGNTISGEFKITNEAPQAQTYYTEVENFEARDETGNPSFIPSPEGLATWVDVDDEIRVPAGEQVTVPYTISVPANTDPGGYFASIFIRTTPPPARGGEVSIGARLGTLIFLRVNGNIVEGVDILEYGTRNQQRVFNSLPVAFYYRFQNSGADRVKPVGEIKIKNLFRITSKVLNANRTDGSVLPSSIRRFESFWVNSGGGQEDSVTVMSAGAEGGFFQKAKWQWDNFALGLYSAKLDITFGSNDNTAQQTFWFIVLPWQLIILLVSGLLIALILLRFTIRRYNRYIIGKMKMGR